MPPNSEIEKLERRWKENPKGTVFAPYAEVLRKHGDHLLARDVLRQGLELHPDHIPGNIVLGRCCLDLREDGPAEAAFTHVLDLDPENVIALKALAEITERQGRLMEARGWLSRLMAVDPSNDEARDQLERVDTAREAAAATIAVPVTVPPGLGVASAPVAASDETTVVVEALPRSFAPQPGPMVEVAAGEVSDKIEEVEVAIDLALGAFDPPPAKPASPALPVMPEEPAALADLEPAEFDLSSMGADLTAGTVEGLESEEPFAPPPPSPPPLPELPEVFAIGVEEPSTLDLTPSGASEFQAPDGAEELLNISMGPRSEFQVPNASEELTLVESTASEYQSPSGAEELLSTLEEPSAIAPVLEPEPAPVEPAPARPVPFTSGGPVTTGFAAITIMPTEELSTSFPAPAREPEAAVSDGVEGIDQPEAPALSVVDQLASVAGVSATPPEVPEGPWEEESAPESQPEPELGSDGGSPRPSELKLIFPDDAAEPEPPRARRITQEVRQAGSEPAPEPPVVAEPEPVLTESMAELYARQGHFAEALRVYRSLLAQQPHDARLAERIRMLEQVRGAGARRLSYVAMDTGGESVESFFRSLAGARPGGSGGADDSAEGAPTRPARDPLSLSAIFGEEPAATAQPGSSPEPSRGGAGDAFSFDQFFGANQPGGSSTGPRQAMPSEEDLDQFQHWLKSLKR